MACLKHRLTTAQERERRRKARARRRFLRMKALLRLQHTRAIELPIGQAIAMSGLSSRRFYEIAQAGEIRRAAGKVRVDDLRRFIEKRAA